MSLARTCADLQLTALPKTAGQGSGMNKSIVPFHVALSWSGHTITPSFSSMKICVDLVPSLLLRLEPTASSTGRGPKSELAKVLCQSCLRINNKSRCASTSISDFLSHKSTGIGTDQTGHVRACLAATRREGVCQYWQLSFRLIFRKQEGLVT